MTEREIAAQLGISRTPVREALRVLEAEGLAVSTRGRGMLVRRVTAEEINETYEVRAVLEGFAARLAAERVSRQGLVHLKRLDKEMERALDRSYETEAERVRTLGSLNAEFHLAVAATAGNRILERTIAGLVETPLHARAYFWYPDPKKRASVADHEQFIDLLESGDAAACASFWEQHLFRGRDYLIEHLREREPPA